MKPVMRNNAKYYGWGEGCHAWHLCNSPALSVIEEEMPPGTSEVMHRHVHARQFFYILEGRALMRCSGDDVTLQAGEGLNIAPGTPHCIVNTVHECLRFLVVSQPHAHGDRVTMEAEKRSDE